MGLRVKKEGAIKFAVLVVIIVAVVIGIRLYQSKQKVTNPAVQDSVKVPLDTPQIAPKTTPVTDEKTTKTKEPVEVKKEKKKVYEYKPVPEVKKKPATKKKEDRENLDIKL